MDYIERLSRTFAQKSKRTQVGYQRLTTLCYVFLVNCCCVLGLEWSFKGFKTGMIALLGVSAFWVTIFLENVYVQSTNHRKTSLKAWIRRVYKGKIIKFLFSASLLALALQTFPHVSQTILFSYLLSIGFCVATLPMHDRRGL